MKKIFVGLGALLLSISTPAAVWEVKANWNSQTEESYRNWVIENWNNEYFTAEGPFKGLTFDCADAVYAMRFVYAYTAKLPFEMNDPTGGKKPITQAMSRWDQLPEDQRARHFLLYSFELFSTLSLAQDTYPAGLDRKSLGAGSVIVTDRANHHSWTVQSFNQNGIPFLVFGSRPATTVLYTRHEYPTVGFIFPLGLNAATNAGFRNFKQPQDLKTPSLQIASASLEQYQIAPRLWSSTIQKIMANSEEDLNTYAKRLLAGACQSLKERQEIVLKAFALNQQLGAQCLNATQYDDYSTPSRDQRFSDQALVLAELFKKWQTQPTALDEEAAGKMQSVHQGENSGADPNAYCRIAVTKNKTLTLGQALSRVYNKKTSSNPMDSVERRWGFVNEPSQKARQCPSF